ncbi:UNVERIFIED_CONTAM: hypothetical protein DES50_10624 [Williamsia faeni]
MALATAAVFVWIGMVPAISFIESCGVLLLN